MDEAVVKQGSLYLQLQQTFGKRWRKFWGILYRESSCSTARLELFEGSAPPSAERLRRSEGGRRVVRLSDCVHVAEAPGDTSGPKDTVPFLLETTDKCYLLAAEVAEAADWVGKLCELAFPNGQQAMLKSEDGKFSMEENSLYSSVGLEKEFEVTVRATESSERCRLWGRFLLRAEEEALELRDAQTLAVLYSWPYRFLRRFGRDKVTFSFEAGRRCASGEGSFEFETRQGNEIFQVIEAAIEAQRGRAAEEPRRDDGPAAGDPAGAFLPSRGAESPYAEPCDSLRRAGCPAGAKAPEKGRKPEPAGRQPPPPPAARLEHIYDEPEGLSAHSVYDEPEEVKGEAWRLQAAPEDPPGHEYPYNPQRDDYSVPKRPVPVKQPFAVQGKEWLGDSEYDNVALKFARKRNLQ
uniref:Docking protein 2 n=1 Tax=Dromaius novaehollandiae TaxID=8790 RepID=A0A8C4JL93_DRONO